MRRLLSLAGYSASGAKAGNTGEVAFRRPVPRTHHPRAERHPEFRRRKERGWLASYISAYLHPRLSFQSCPDFFTRGQGSCLFAACRQDLSKPGPLALQKRLHWRRRRAEWGWGLRSTMRAPRSAVRNSSNPSCWNARPGRLLHSGPNVFVIIPDRSSAPPPPASPG